MLSRQAKAHEETLESGAEAGHHACGHLRCQLFPKSRCARATVSRAGWLARIAFPEPATPVAAVIGAGGALGDGSRRRVRCDHVASLHPRLGSLLLKVG